MSDKPVCRVSVRDLVEYILRSGDIDARRGSSDKEAMLKGSRIHRKIQKQMGGSYRPEVPLKYEKEYDDLILRIEGRADGLFEKEGMQWVDEIKGIKAGISGITEPVPVHLAQAKCYACMLDRSRQNETENQSKAAKANIASTAADDTVSYGIQMTYASLDTEEIRRFQQIFTGKELSSWFDALLLEYHKWVSFRLAWINKRNESAAGLGFPFEYREGQKKLAGSIYHTIAKGKQIFVQAPTGIGKTMAAVFPAVRSLGEGKASALFYLTARTTTRTVAEEAFRILEGEGLLFKSVTITAKEKMCLCDQVSCNPEDCPYAKGYEDRVNDAVFSFLQQQVLYDRETILAYAKEKELCPFEFTLDLSLWVDGIICDYNYVFDPDVYLRRFFGEGRNERYIFLVDESHNLVDRSREMYSATIRRRTIMDARKKSKGKVPSLYKALNRANKILLQLEKETEEGTVLESPGALPLALLNAQGEIEKLFEEESMRGFTEEILDEYFEIRKFMNTYDLLDDNYVVYTGKDEGGKVTERLFCVNPARNLSAHLEQSAGTVFFSATLLPMQYYRKLLSTSEDVFGVYVPSPFPRENRRIIYCSDVSSRYKRRGYSEYRRMAEYISKMVLSKKGNYMAFFPSYAMLDAVYQVYEQEFSMPGVTAIRQMADMGEAEREDFLAAFHEGNYLIGFCIMGGIFSEGIDLKGEALIGAAIIGPGLPQVSMEREILRKYYDDRNENGFDYAYRFPGMNKVLQAAGRVIRTGEDRGVILLLDDRFRETDYSSLMPIEWADRTECRLPHLSGVLYDFWQKRTESSLLDSV